MKIKYVIGDVTAPQGDGIKIITHIVNDSGGWGRGVVLAISKRWPIEKESASPEWCYREWGKKKWQDKPFVLGQIQTVWVEGETFVCNMIAQRDYRTLEEEGISLELPNCKLSSLLECLTRLLVSCEKAVNAGKQVSIHAPRFGAGLGGEKWKRIEKVINQVYGNNGVPFYVYDQTPVKDTVYER